MATCYNVVRSVYYTKPALCHKQSGVTLVVVLIMLTVITLLAITAINLSSINLKIVGNVQQRLVAESVAQTAIERTLNSSTRLHMLRMAALKLHSLIPQRPTG